MAVFSVVSPEQAKLRPYLYVYVNDDGSARELFPREREHLEMSFDPFDGGRPYVKENYLCKDGWNSIAGYCLRSALPTDVRVSPAPDKDPWVPGMTAKELRERLTARSKIPAPTFSGALSKLLRRCARLFRRAR